MVEAKHITMHIVPRNITCYVLYIYMLHIVFYTTSLLTYSTDEYERNNDGRLTHQSSELNAGHSPRSLAI